MPVYSSKDRIKSGLPLGGFGAGKLEILPNGLLNAFTFQNNWSSPLNGARENYSGVLGYHFGIYVEKPGSKRPSRKAVLLQTVPVAGIPTVKTIHFEGIFPVAKLIYKDASLGLDVSLEAFSNWLPGNYKDSSLPLVNFVFKIKNKKNTPVRVGLLFVGRNTSGSWCVGRRNTIYENSKSVNLEFSNKDRANRDAAQGTLLFSFLKKGWNTSFLESWNAVSKNFSFNAETILLEAWKEFVRHGKLPDIKKSFTASGENQELCGSVSAERIFKPKEEREFSFCASWYFPQHSIGHRYQTYFKNAAQVARYGLQNAGRFRKKLAAFQKLVYELPFPKWFNDALLTNLSPFFSSTWYAKDGRFCFYEAPVVCPLMGTVDVGYYGSIPLSYFFPRLEMSQLMQFAKSQRRDGYIPHDLGKNRIDRPSDGTTFHFWKDLNPKFILMAYRDYLWSQDIQFLKTIYPHVQKAIRWTLKTDFDGNGLPDNEGADQTFDLWEFYGTNAYTSGLFLAALLACEKMARRLNDAAFAKFAREAFEKGQRSFERELWNGKYFGQGPCALSQLNGQWYADLLGLGDIASKDKIRKALHTTLKLSGSLSGFGMVNSVYDDGRLDTANDHSKNIWAGMNYAFISLCVSRGLPKGDLLKQAHKIWDNVTRIQKSPWNQPDTVDSKTGGFVFGDSYYRNMAIWAIPIAYAAHDKKTKRILSKLRRFKS